MSIPSPCSTDDVRAVTLEEALAFIQQAKTVYVRVSFSETPCDTGYIETTAAAVLRAFDLHRQKRTAIPLVEFRPFGQICWVGA